MKKLKKPRLPNLNYKKLAIRLTVLGVFLLAITGYVAYNRLYLTNERRFWMAMGNNLQTRSVVRTVESGGTGNKTIEKTRFNYGYEATNNRITSVGSKNATSESDVTTQNILTPTEQFIRYLNISTSEKKSDGTDYDFSSVVGVWAEQPKATNPEEAEQMKLSFVQPHITVAIFANMSPANRSKIINKLKDGVYDIDYNNTSKQPIDGRDYISYPAKVRLKKYVKVLQDSFDIMGYGTFPPLNPDNYPENARYNVQFLVDPRDNTLAGIKLDYQIEYYTNFGANVPAPIPTSAIPIDQLQEQLQAQQ